MLHLIVLVLGPWSLPAGAQTDPRTLPRVQAGDVTKLGTITLTGAPDALAVDGNTLYASFGTCVQPFTLPALGGTATPVGACVTVPNLDQVHPTDRNVIVGGILRYQGEFVTSAFIYYDGSAGAQRSHWKGASLAALAGPFTVSTAIVGTGQLDREVGEQNGPRAPLPSNRPAMVAGGMGTVPAEWRALLGGPALTERCCVPIISRSSYGPSFSVFDPAHLDGRAVVPATMLAGYPIEHRTLGPWEGVSPYYGGTDQIGGIGFPSGTRSILLTGRHGDSWCYGPGTANKALVGTIDPAVSQYPYCYDPTDSYQGNHGPPYRPTMWAYDAAELIAVKDGTKKPWDVQPYAKWTLPGMVIDGVQNLMRAGFYDHATRRYYVGMNDSKVVHVFAIGLGGGGGGPVDADAVCAAPVVTVGQWAPTACPVPPAKPEQFATETTTVATITPAVGNGKACPAPTTRQLQRACDPVQPPPTPAIRLECDRITTIVRGADYVGGDQRWTVRGVCREINAAGAVVGPPK